MRLIEPAAESNGIHPRARKTVIHLQTSIDLGQKDRPKG